MSEVMWIGAALVLGLLAALIVLNGVQARAIRQLHMECELLVIEVELLSSALKHTFASLTCGLPQKAQQDLIHARAQLEKLEEQHG